MFEVHGWVELVGDPSDTDAAAERIDQMTGPDSEWKNGLLAVFWSNGARFVHVARRWNHRDVGRAALDELRTALGETARGKLDVLDHEELRSEVWWLEAGQFEREQSRSERMRRWMA